MNNYTLWFFSQSHPQSLTMGRPSTTPFATSLLQQVFRNDRSCDPGASRYDMSDATGLLRKALRMACCERLAAKDSAKDLRKYSSNP